VCVCYSILVKTLLELWASLRFILWITTLLSVPYGGLKKSPRTCILCCYISPVQRSGVVFTVDFIASYGPFCHSALKLDISTLFTTFCIWTSLQFILTTPFLIRNLLEGIIKCKQPCCLFPHYNTFLQSRK